VGDTQTTSIAPESALLERARSGDESAFGDLVGSYRGELQAHCYRMLGSVHDAEDAVQDAMLRAWRGLSRFEGRSSLRSWLYKIATNTCLDAIARRPKRLLPSDHVAATPAAEGVGEPLVESVWMEPYPDETLAVEDGYAGPEARYEQREAVELAFIAALQHLPARQRAVLISREVLGFSAQEVADSLESSTASVNSALQRARKTIDERLPEQSQQATLRSLGDGRVREIVENYMEAMQRGDVNTVVSMLTADVAWSMPPLASWFRGIEQVEAFLTLGPLSGEWRWRHVSAQASGQAAVGVYSWDEAEQCYRPFALDVLTLEGDRIKEVTAFITRTTEATEPDFFSRWPAQALDPARLAAFERFGLPARID
jgi:RNA polymerase sigma-70 factor (ECF subfamily)